MALSKAEVRNAFREVAMRELSTIPPKETIDHSFSKQFYEKMVSLIAEQKRGSWRLLSRQRRRALVVAAILVLSMLLVACTPTLRNAVSDFIVSVYERFVDYEADVELRQKIETVYELGEVPSGFELMSQEKPTPYFATAVYESKQGTILQFSQQAGQSVLSFADNEHSEVIEESVDGKEVVLYRAERLVSATWIQDGYYMTITYTGGFEEIEIDTLILSVCPIE